MPREFYRQTLSHSEKRTSHMGEEAWCSRLNGIRKHRIFNWMQLDLLIQMTVIFIVSDR